MAMVGTARDGLRNVQQTRREKASSGKKTQDTLHAVSAAALDMPGIAISYGSQRSNQSSQVDTTTERGSTLRAAGDLTLNATGGDLTVIGSALSVGGTAEKGTEEVKCHRALLPPATVARAAARSLGLNVV
jgi:filamentous hemagglutinin